MLGREDGRLDRVPRLGWAVSCSEVTLAGVEVIQPVSPSGLHSPRLLPGRRTLLEKWVTCFQLVKP